MQKKLSYFTLGTTFILLIIYSCSPKVYPQLEVNNNYKLNLYFLFNVEEKLNPLISTLSDSILNKLENDSINYSYSFSKNQSYYEKKRILDSINPNELIDVIVSEKIRENPNIASGDSDIIFDFVAFNYENKSHSWHGSMVIKNYIDTTSIINQFYRFILEKYELE